MAAGFSLREDQLPAFKKFAGEYILKHLGAEKIVPTLNIDCMASLSAVNEQFAEDMQFLEPYGTDNPEPQIMLSSVRFGWAQIVGSGHVKCTLLAAGGEKLPAIAFRAADNAIGQAMLQNKGDVFDVVGNVRCDNWQGRKRIQILINDIKRKS